MGILIFAILVIIVVALAVWAIGLLPLPSPFNQIIQALIVLLGAVVIAGRAGVF